MANAATLQKNTGAKILNFARNEKAKDVYAKKTYPIIADFFSLDNAHTPVWRNRGLHPRRVSKNAQDYLHENTHDKAWIAVVWNEDTGRLICIWRRDVHGDVHSLYRDVPYDPKVLTDFPQEWLEFSPK